MRIPTKHDVLIGGLFLFLTVPTIVNFYILVAKPLTTNVFAVLMVLGLLGLVLKGHLNDRRDD